MKVPLVLTGRKLAAAAGLVVAGALAVGWSGFVSIAANTGHFAPVEWFLHWTMRNAVATQSLGIAVPPGVDLADPVLVQKAAGHFATGCAPCHGAPGVNQTAEYRAMMPPPPRLEDKVGEWRDRELFWIGRHGIKYSGMPAWATQERPDEVWALVAFLRALPAMTPDAYRDLALGGANGLPVPIGQASPALPDMNALALADCARCHGRNGLGRAVASADGGSTAGAFPPIAGQGEAYLYETLVAYASGARHSGIMQPAASRYGEDTLRFLAAHYAAQPVGAPAAGARTAPTAIGFPEAPTRTSATNERPPPALVDEADAAASRAAIDRIVDPAAGHGGPRDRAGLLALGERLAREGVPEQKVPACESCHGAGARTKNPLYPYLAGQPAWYIATHLQLWKDGKRRGTPAARLMDDIAIHLTEQQIEAVALWYSAEPVGR